MEASIAHLNTVESGRGYESVGAELMSRDLSWPKSGHWNKQTRCDLCEEGRDSCDNGWTDGILGVLVSLCVIGMVGCHISYVVFIVPNERSDLVKKILCAHTCMNFFTAITVGFIIMPNVGEPIFIFPRGPAGIMVFIMGRYV
eukprot:COSAG02_NODE_9676_length_2146_cov_1.671226_2_plen_143_part_00